MQARNAYCLILCFGATRRIVRSVHLENDVTEMVAHQSFWLIGRGRKLEQKCSWEIKRDLP